MPQNEIIHARPVNSIGELKMTAEHELRRAQKAFDEADGVARRGVLHYKKAGDALLACKEIVRAKGESWLKWLDENFGKSAPTAQGCMRIAKNWSKVKATNSYNEALKLLQGKQKPPPQKRGRPNVYTRVEKAGATLRGILEKCSGKLERQEKMRLRREILEPLRKILNQADWLPYGQQPDEEE